MPTYIVGVEKGLTDEQFADARSALEKQGAKIVSKEDEFSREGLSPGFEVSFPTDSVKTLESIPHFYSVEDSEDRKTQ